LATFNNGILYNSLTEYNSSTNVKTINIYDYVYSADSLRLRTILYFIIERFRAYDNATVKFDCKLEDCVYLFDYLKANLEFYLKDNLYAAEKIIYNGAVLNAVEFITVSDMFSTDFKYYILENIRAYDELDFGLLFNLIDELVLTDTNPNAGAAGGIDLSAEYSLSEKLRIAEKVLFETIHRLYDTVKTADEFILKVHHELTEKFGINDFEELKLFIIRAFQIFESFNVTDRDDIAHSESDFIIRKSADGLYHIFDPFGFMIDWKQSEIGVIPEVTDETIKIQGRDGELTLNSTYRSRFFNIVGYSLNNLTEPQKNILMTKIANTIHDIKSGTKKLTRTDIGVSYDVKYTGKAELLTDYGDYIKFTLPMKSDSPYARNEFPNIFYGNGFITNNGTVEADAVFTVTGAVNDFVLNVGGTSMLFTGTVAPGESLIIDTANMTCFIIKPNGQKVNAMRYFEGNFPKIKPGAVTINIDPQYAQKLKTEWIERYIFGRGLDKITDGSITPV